MDFIISHKECTRLLIRLFPFSRPQIFCGAGTSGSKASRITTGAEEELSSGSRFTRPSIHHTSCKVSSSRESQAKGSPTDCFFEIG